MSFAGQIEYNSIIVNFVRQWNNFSVSKNQTRASLRSGAGIKEYLNFFNQDFIQAVKERLTAQELAELLQFYEFAKDGSSFIFTRDRGLGAYWNFEKTLNNNDENALTFTRTAGEASNASYVDPSTGLLTFEDTLNIPRYGSGKYGHGLVIEGARTNLCFESETLDGVDWSVTNITVAQDTTEVLDPAGGNNATKCTSTAADAIITYLTETASNTLDITNSIYVRCASGTVAGDIKVVDSVGGIEATTDFIATPEWQRVQVLKENSTGAGNIALRVQIDPDATVLYLYGAQIEAAADNLFASNYIKSDLGSELMPNQVDRDFSGASAWADFNLDAYDETGDLTLLSSAANQYCTCPVASAPTTIGQTYKMTFDVANNSSNWVIKSFDGTQTIGTISTNGAQVLIWTATTTGGYRVVAGSTITAGDFDNFTLQKITKTRNADRAKLAPTNIIGNLKGTIMMWIKPEIQVFNEHPGFFLYEHGDSGGGDIHSRFAVNSSGQLLAGVTDALGNEVATNVSIESLFTAGEWAHVAMTYDSTISNGVKAYYNGTLLDTTANDAFVPKAQQDFFNIGTNRVGNLPAFGIIEEILIRKDVLPGSMIAQIFQQGVGLGEIRNRWPSVALSDPDFLEEQLKGINRYNVILNLEEVLS